MSAIIAQAVEWAAKPGPPNAVFVLALLTAPWLWADYAKRAGRRIINRFTGGQHGDK